MFAPYQRDDLTEALAVQLDQRLAVPVLLCGHAVEDARGRGVFLAERLGIHPVDPAVILFGRDRQREDFLLGQIGEPAATGDETHDMPLFRTVLI